MAGKEYSSYQQNVIKNYYRNLDAISLQRLGELVTELYLADTDKKKERLWMRVQVSLEKLKIPPSVRQHILSRRDVEALARNLNEWLGKK